MISSLNKITVFQDHGDPADNDQDNFVGEDICDDEWDETNSTNDETDFLS